VTEVNEVNEYNIPLKETIERDIVQAFNIKLLEDEFQKV